MEPLNIKIIPLTIIAMVLSYFSFAHIANLLVEIEILFDLAKVLEFLLLLILLMSLTALTISLTFALTKNTYLRVAIFFVILLPYASIFIIPTLNQPLASLAFLALFLGMVTTMYFEFDRFYGNQIKAHIDLPARANARTMAFFLAITAAVAFFVLNNDPITKNELTDRIINNLMSSTMQAIEDYGLVDQVIESQTGGLGRAVPTEAITPQVNQFISSQIVTLIEPYKPYIVYILTALVFATISGAATFIGLAATLFSYVLLPLLKSTGYIRETKETVEVTRITV